MHARDEPARKYKTGPKSVAPRHAAATPVLGGSPRSPGAMLALQRSVGNRAASLQLAQEEHQHGAGCGHTVADDSRPAVQRALISDALSGMGSPIPSAERKGLESFYRTDLSTARIHTDPVAQRATAALGAEAMTIGNHVLFARGAERNRSVLGHEAKHLSENIRGVRETGADNGAGVSVTDPGQSSERTAAADGAAFAAGAAIAPSIGVAQRSTEAQPATPALAVQGIPVGQDQDDTEDRHAEA